MHYFNIMRIHNLPVLFQEFELSMPGYAPATSMPRLLAMPEPILETMRHHCDLYDKAKLCMKAMEQSTNEANGEVSKAQEALRAERENNQALQQSLQSMQQRLHDQPRQHG
jgi:hypothetical protein